MSFEDGAAIADTPSDKPPQHEPSRADKDMAIEEAQGMRNATSNNTQWRVGGNNTFGACGTTVKTLPAGLYTVSNDSNRNIVFTKKKVVTDDLFDLGDGRSQAILADIEEFWKSKDIYKQYGLTYKRGLLMHGPSGGGKTVIVMRLCEALIRAGGVVINNVYTPLTAASMQELRLVEPERPLIVIFEDVEETIKDEGEQHLLALLDGEHQIENVVTIATTNSPDLLGDRIVNRPSRFDLVEHVGLPSVDARSRYLKIITRGEWTAEKIEQAVRDTDKFNLGHLRELVAATLCLGRDYQVTLDRLRSMFKRPKPSSTMDNKVGVLTK